VTKSHADIGGALLIVQFEIPLRQPMRRTNARTLNPSAG